jgi:voltage-gated potassium channel
MVERNPELAEKIGDLPDRLIIGDAADRDVMRAVGIEDAPSVLLTTNRDEANIYLAAYTRRISPEAQIVSRITHERNLPSIQRAGADLTLSYDTLAVETLLSHCFTTDRQSSWGKESGSTTSRARSELEADDLERRAP